MKRQGRLLAALVILVGIGGLVATDSSADDVRGVTVSSLAAGPEGAKALYLLLGHVGLRTSRWTDADYEDLPKGTLWVLTDRPLPSLTVLALRSWLAAGNTLVGAPGAVAPLMRDKKLKLETDETAAALTALGGERLQVEKAEMLEYPSPPEEVLVKASTGDPVVARWKIGEGRLIVLGIASAVRNGKIGLADNGRFFARLALDLGGAQIFDEVQTGLGDTGLWLWLGQVPYRAAIWHALAALLLAVWALWPRRVAPDAPSDLRRRATMEHLQAVARFWERAKDPRLPLDEIQAALEERARRRGGKSFQAWVALARPELAESARMAWTAAAAANDTESAQEVAAGLLRLEREALRW